MELRRIGTVACGISLAFPMLTAGSTAVAAPAPIDLGGSTGYALALSGGWAVGRATFAPNTDMHAFAADVHATSPSAIDLGTLGGSQSAATAIDGTLVVGSAQLSNTNSHAFVDDLANSRAGMVDLGTLGGLSSEALAISGQWVVGHADPTIGSQRAFAADVTVRHPRMIDLGTLGGASSDALAVDGDWAVGQSDDGTHLPYGAAWHLTDATPAAVALAPLPGDNEAQALAISGEWAVGNSFGPGPGYIHLAVGWHYDGSTWNASRLNSDNTYSQAAAIDGHWAVGFSYVLGSRHAYAWDLSTSPITSVDLGTLDGAESMALAVRGNWVVGRSQIAGGAWHAFAVDLSQNSLSMVDLGTLSGDSEAVGVDAGWAVGDSDDSGTVTQPVAYPLADTTTDIAVSLAGPAAHAGKSYTATLTVQNLGPSPVTGVTVAVDPVVGGTLTSSAEVTFTDLAAGASVSDPVTVDVQAGGKGATLTIPVHIAGVTGATDLNGANDSATLTVPIRGH